MTTAEINVTIILDALHRVLKHTHNAHSVISVFR